MVLSLVLKVIIAGLHVPLAVAGTVFADGTAAASAQPASFAQFIICTPTGIKTFTLDDNGTPTEVPTPQNISDDCGVCSVLQNAATALSPEADNQILRPAPSAVFSQAKAALCTPRAPSLARGYDPPQV